MTMSVSPGPLGLGSALAALIGVVAVLAAAAAPARAAELPDGFSEDVVFSGLDAPTSVRFSPADDGRVFVAEKNGLIKVFDGLADTEATVFADLTDSVYSLFDRGLLGLELDPEFPDRPYVYALYTHDSNPTGVPSPTWGDECPDPPGPTTDGCVVTGRLSRLEADLDTDEMIDEDVLLEGEWCQQFPSHSMGALAFGPDGYLYASAGDGASYEFTDWGQEGIPPNPCGDPPSGVGGAQTRPSAEGGALRSQDLRTGGDPTGLNGSIIRVDPDDGAPAPGNPNAGPDANARRIVAHGFRNPYRFTVRPGSTGTGDLWIADVGWTEREEIDVLTDPTATPVENFGWPCFEGVDPEPDFASQSLAICANLYAEENAGQDLVDDPYYVYPHGGEVVPGDQCHEENGAVISGIDFYEDGGYPAEYDGALFFGDYGRGCIWTMLPDATGEPDPDSVETLVEEASQPVDMQVGPGGDLFYVDFGFDSPIGGAIRRVRFVAPTAVATADRTYGDDPLDVQFDGTGSHTADGGAVDEYEWDLDGDGEFDDSTDPAPPRVYTDGSTNVAARLRVTDSEGRTDLSEPITISPGNLGPPTVMIDEPVDVSRWQVSEEIDFSAHATDLEDESGEPGDLPGSALDWTISIEHCPNGPDGCHVHPYEGLSDSGSGSIVGPDHEYPSDLIFEVVAKDHRGLQDVATLHVDAERADLSFRTTPVSGVELTVDTDVGTTPFTRTVVAGSPQTVEAPASIFASPALAFDSWSDGGARLHEVDPPAGASTYTASYRSDEPPAQPADPSPPPGSLALRRTKRNRKRGTAKLTVRVSGPGRLTLEGRKVKRIRKEIDAAGKTKIPVKPTAKAKRKLRRAGKAKVRVEVRFTPTGGEPVTREETVNLVMRRRR